MAKKNKKFVEDLIKEEVKPEDIEEVDEVVEKPKKEVKEKPAFYKGYEMKWLKKEASEAHPDKYLVKEYEELYGIV